MNEWLLSAICQKHFLGNRVSFETTLLTLSVEFSDYCVDKGILWGYMAPPDRHFGEKCLY